MSELSKQIPKLDIKLSGASTYTEWTVSLERYLDLMDVGTTEYRVWDVVTGTYPRPSEPTEDTSADEATKIRKEIRAWKDADGVALLTIRKNCKDEIRARIGNLDTAQAAYDELKKAYQGRIVTEFYALLNSLTSVVYDDQKTTIDDHIALYERIWNTFVGVITRADLGNDDGFGTGLKALSKSDRAKAEFLLRSLPPCYSNTVENIRLKEYGYEDVARKLREYIPHKQKGWRTDKTEGSKENLVIHRIEQRKPAQDNGKRCDFCIAKGWRGLNHTEIECYTKAREQAKAKRTGGSEKVQKSQTETTKGGESGTGPEEGVVKAIKIGGARISEPEKAENIQYSAEIATSHHTTSQVDLLTDVPDINIPVLAHNGSKSISRQDGQQAHGEVHEE